MRARVFGRGLMRKRQERAVRALARKALGRLHRHVKHTELTLKDETPEDPENSFTTCTLRLRLREATDVLILARGPHVGDALRTAFRRARHELMRRRRAAAAARSWHNRPQPAIG